MSKSNKYKKITKRNKILKTNLERREMYIGTYVSHEEVGMRQEDEGGTGRVGGGGGGGRRGGQRARQILEW